MTRRLDLLIPAAPLTALAISLLACGGDTGDLFQNTSEPELTLCSGTKAAPLSRLAVGATLTVSSYVGQRPLLLLGSDCYGEPATPTIATSSDPAIVEVVTVAEGFTLKGKAAGEVTLTIEAGGEAWSGRVTAQNATTHRILVRSADNALLDDLKPELPARLGADASVVLEPLAYNSANEQLSGTFEGMWSVAPDGAASLQKGTSGRVTLSFGAMPQAVTVTSPGGGTRAVEPATPADLGGVAVINSTTLTRSPSSTPQQHAAANYNPQQPELLLVGLIPQDAEGRDLFGIATEGLPALTFALRADAGGTTDGLTLVPGTELDASLGVAPGWSFTVSATKPAQASVVVTQDARELAVIPIVFAQETPGM